MQLGVMTQVRLATTNIEQYCQQYCQQVRVNRLKISGLAGTSMADGKFNHEEERDHEAKVSIQNVDWLVGN